jgi:hypothetical protein
MVDWSDIALWSLAGTWALVVGTLYLMYWQTRVSRHLNSANAVMTLRERFDSEHMRAVRRQLADRLIRRAHEDITSVEVVTFFELVGTLTRRGVLDEELVWEAFGSWVTSYYRALRHPVDLIGQLRASLEDPLVSHEFEWLNDRILELDRHESGPASSRPDPDQDALHILRREAALERI